MANFTILLDVDGVLANLVQKLCDDYNRVAIKSVDAIWQSFFSDGKVPKAFQKMRDKSRQEEITPADFKVWNFMDYKHEGSPFVSKEEIAITQKIMASEGWPIGLVPYPGALDAVNGMRSLDMQVKFVTTPYIYSRGWTQDRESWLIGRMDADNQRRDIVHAYDKSLVSGDVFVDDNPKNVLGWAKAHPTKHAFLQRRPWNYQWWANTKDTLPANFQTLSHIGEFVRQDTPEDPWRL